MFDHRIEIHAFLEFRDEYNDRTKRIDFVAEAYAQRTEAGGRENMYASRIVHENEVVYTIRWRSHILPGMLLKDGDDWLRIVGTQEEGRHHRLHIRAVKTDAKDLNSILADSQNENDHAED